MTQTHSNDVFQANDMFQEKLPDDPAEAVKYLIQIGLNLEGALIEEFKALEKRDAGAFQIAQEKKNRRFVTYDMVASEFRYNLEKHKDVASDLLNQLEALQKNIKEQSQKNLDVMTALLENAQASEMGINPEDIEKLKQEQKGS